ncbi:DUF6231 family protein [Pseudomonas oligotrophica]|uniref:DUF6231 family protein n=1 Tax=Pseudomonas oligotrophica TaxID=2912055 RepID=UPI001F43C295|nr:DUF6231 family protein [Pseudomonas oligotrophica]MCF7203036.1 DUF6231 family protein [Pseudomonas oligotrophica]
MTALQPLTPQQALAALLEHHRPTRILHVGHSDQPAITAYAENHPDARVERCSAAPTPAQATQRYDLAIVADCLEHLPRSSGQQLLGGLRNLNSSRLAVLVDLADADWQLTDFYALALQVNQRFRREDQTLTLLSYDLLEYKQAPDWLNAKFWANPQNFGKYWW